MPENIMSNGQRYVKNIKNGHTEIDVVFSINGRLRLRVSKEAVDPKNILDTLKKAGYITSGKYTSTNRSFVLHYEVDLTENDAQHLNKLILNFCGYYCKDQGISEIKLNYKLSKQSSMGYSSLISLAFIALDFGLNFIGLGAADTAILSVGTATTGAVTSVASSVASVAANYRSFVRWCAVGTTIGAIFEHGYKELNENGAFDPEVMSIMYLINSVSKDGVSSSIEGNSYFYPPIIAWLLTFGRHILTRQNRSIIISTIQSGDKMKIVEQESKSYFFNQFLGSCLDVYQNASLKKSLIR